MFSIRFTADADVRDEFGVVVQRFHCGELVRPDAMPLASRLYWLDAGSAEVAELPAARAPRRRKAAAPA